VTHTIRQTEITALQDSCLSNTSSVTILYPHQKKKNVSRYVFRKKHDVLRCLYVGLLRTFQVFSVSSKIVYRWITTNLSFMSHIWNRNYVRGNWQFIAILVWGITWVATALLGVFMVVSDRLSDCLTISETIIGPSDHYFIGPSHRHAILEWSVTTLSTALSQTPPLPPTCFPSWSSAGMWPVRDFSFRNLVIDQDYIFIWYGTKNF
jgi:hypothetical protein